MKKKAEDPVEMFGDYLDNVSDKDFNKLLDDIDAMGLDDTSVEDVLGIRAIKSFRK